MSRYRVCITSRVLDDFADVGLDEANVDEDLGGGGGGGGGPDERFGVPQRSPKI